jgi:protein phosphatase PTC1
LTKDHKPQDEEETKRIQAEGGFVGNHGRVNGVLAVSRALGDHMLKPFVSAEPHVTTTRLKNSDLFMIIACDGV